MRIEEIAMLELGHLDADELRSTLDSECTITARRGESALEVAARYDEAKGGVVVLVSEDGSPEGIVDPGVIRRRLVSHEGVTANSLGEAVETLKERIVLYGTRPQRPGPGWLVRAFTPYYCVPGRHFTAVAPCPVHEI